MHRKLIFLLLLLISFFSFSLAQDSKKRALLVGIGDYPNPSKNGWSAISSARDIELMRFTLQLQNFKDISILKDKQATKSGIEKALQDLYNKSQKGDIILIHFSAHGIQLEDDENDENEEPDLLDESIVPYGAIYSDDPSRFEELKSHYLRDDDLGDFVVKLRNKIGSQGSILVTLDACHSGTGIRDAGNIIRGPYGALVSPGFEKRSQSRKPDIGVINEFKTRTPLSNDAATYVSISGSQSNQSNKECEDDEKRLVGSLTYAFCKSLTQLKANSSYRTLFSLIENIMHQKVPNQSPVLEGDGIDKALFGNQYIPFRPYLSIYTEGSTKEKINLNGGGIWGLTKGSKVGFYDQTCINPTGIKPLMTGTITEVSAFSSVVKPDTILEGILSMNPKIYINEIAYGDQPLKLAILDEKGKPIPTSEILPFKEALKDFSLINFDNENYDVYLIKESKKNSYILSQKASNENFASGISIQSSKEIETLKESLRKYDRIRYLKSLELKEFGFSAKVNLVFLTGDKPEGAIDTARINHRTVNGRLELQEGDIVYLRIVNDGERSFYFNIVDIEPDGKINRLVPNKTLKNSKGVLDQLLAQDCFLERGSSMIIRRFRIKLSPPFGNYTFKVFLGPKQFNLEDILATDDLNYARNINPALSKLEKLFIASKVNTEGKRAIELISTLESGAAFNYNFILKPKN